MKKRTEVIPVKVEFRTITPVQWSKICSITWTPVTRRVIGALFAHNGIGHASIILEGVWSRAMQINRIFIKHNLPFRLKGNDLSHDQYEPDGYFITTQQIKLCTVV